MTHSAIIKEVISAVLAALRYSDVEYVAEAFNRLYLSTGDDYGNDWTVHSELFDAIRAALNDD